MNLSRLLAAAFASAALAIGTAAQPVAAADNPYERGPAPTTSSIEALRGPYAVSTKIITSRAARGYGGGTIYYPSSTADGTFGVIAISPGFVSPQRVIAWLGPRLASQGFVVITIDTFSGFNQPASRGDQLLAAVDQTIADPTVGSRIDPSRQALIGHSMGGGGTLEAAKDRPSIEATIGLTPWNSDKTWPEVEAASLVIGAQNDSIAPVASHAIPFYSSLTNAERRSYLELGGANHFAPTSDNTLVAKYTIAWLKRYVDNDARYEQFIAPGPVPSAASGISDYRLN
ncbi:lipase [Aeromicrobium flavum]|uniref:Lipase n=1 Tax=Aeromicrobium flavum TaxID=416568 RepID=A0A512HXW6_9ACTN|nr:alpha/beta hydrolase [Aeromicrobium flavum]GEO90291.1 lipase [Aeromicrobium flavum]